MSKHPSSLLLYSERGKRREGEKESYMHDPPYSFPFCFDSTCSPCPHHLFLSSALVVLEQPPSLPPLGGYIIIYRARVYTHTRTHVHTYSSSPLLSSRKIIICHIHQYSVAHPFALSSISLSLVSARARPFLPLAGGSSGEEGMWLSR